MSLALDMQIAAILVTGEPMSAWAVWTKHRVHSKAVLSVEAIEAELRDLERREMVVSADVHGVALYRLAELPVRAP